MKLSGICFFLAFLPNSIYGQYLDHKQLRIKDLNFYSTKAQIIEKLGIPIKTYEPNNECGFLSEDEQGHKFYTLEYLGIKFTGNELDKYLIEEIDFIANNSVQLYYSKHLLTSISSTGEFSRIFGAELEDKPNGVIKIYFKNSDAAIFFEFKNGTLIKLDYWSPC